MAIRRADVAAIVIDSEEGLTAQDAHVAQYCVDEGCACMIVMNKWDLVEKDHRTADELTRKLNREWPFMRYAPVLYLSAKTGQRAERVLDVAKRIYLNAGRRIQTGPLNQLLENWTRSKPPPIRKNRKPKIRYMTQVGTHPPTFALFVNEPALIHFSYQRYLVNCLRATEDFEGTPIRILKRRSGEKGPANEGKPFQIGEQGKKEVNRTAQEDSTKEVKAQTLIQDRFTRPRDGAVIGHFY